MLNSIVFMFFCIFFLHSHHVLILHPEFRQVGLRNEAQINNFSLLLLIILTFGVFFSKTKEVVGCGCFFGGGGVVFFLR